MKAEPVTELTGVRLRLSVEEARGLYAELYRVSADELNRSWPPGSQVAELMRALAQLGVDA